MRHHNRTLCVLGLALAGTTAQAGTVIDFVEMTEQGAYGESAYNTLSITTASFKVDITAVQNGQSALAYLDNQHAGLGACGALLTDASTGQDSGNTGNKCDPSSDDNVTTAEKLNFVFDTDVVIEKIWLNNTHDDDKQIVNPETVLIDGTSTLVPGNGFAPGGTTDYNTAALHASAANFLGPYSVAAGTSFMIEFGGDDAEQFYVSAMEVRAVPLPGALLLFGSSLLGLFFSGSRKG